ncbi:MAG: hypothetical protein NXH75_16815 [Halobacteriovoraceae bacterium]|nr:hypothetical protein [Halobacteriovoraceae bacterium]
MALNVRPLFDVYYPFMHPLPSIPEDKDPMRSSTSNQSDREEKEKLKEERMKKKVQWMIENASELRFKKLNSIY